MSTLKKYETDKLKKITDWTKRNLNELRKFSPVPIITKLPDGNFKVATYDVVYANHHWEADGKEFFDKRSAIFYCALKHMENIVRAEELYKLDSAVKNLEFDSNMFRIRLNTAHENDDQFRIDLYASRHAESKMMFKLAKRDLEVEITRQFRHLDINKSNTTF